MTTRATAAATIILLSIPGATLVAQTRPAPAQPVTTAADLYARAARLIVVDCPSSSISEFPGYPPFGPEWDAMAAAAWQRNAGARDAARMAGRAQATGWPAGKDWTYLNGCRAVANELGDAALYRGLNGDLPAAIGLVGDLLDLGDKLREPPLDDEREGIHWLVAAGVDALMAERVMVLASGCSDAKSVKADELRRVIGRLLEEHDADAILARAKPDVVTATRPADQAAAFARWRLTFKRVDAERRMAAMSLACNLYRRDQSAWPARADDLVPAYLPALPVDPADGRTPIGYALVKGGLPGGGDRPLVYSREEATGPLAFRTDAPQYAFYLDDGSANAPRLMRPAGQFRDVARWAPAAPPGPRWSPGMPADSGKSPPIQPLPDAAP